MTYRNLRRAARQARSADQIAARKRMEQGTHGLVLHVQGDRTVQEVTDLPLKAAHWWNDLRRGRLHVYGPLLRFLDVAIAAGVPREVLMKIPQMLSFYILDCTDDGDAGQHRKPAA